MPVSNVTKCNQTGKYIILFHQKGKQVISFHRLSGGNFQCSDLLPERKNYEITGGINLPAHNVRKRGAGGQRGMGSENSAFIERNKCI